MSIPSIDLFMGAGSDPEGARYRVLAALADTRRAFSRNLVYPYLAELIELHATLTTLMKQFGAIRDALPGELSHIDLESARLVYRKTDDDLGAVSQIAELVAWALPKIEETIDEGRTIFEFVDEQLKLEEVGIVPAYTEEGYLVVPDLTAEETHVLRYRLSIVTKADERYRSLRTNDVKTIQYLTTRPPVDIKIELAREWPDLPAPAMYYVNSTVDFPYEPTVLPIAKRKLMRYLYSAAA